MARVFVHNLRCNEAAALSVLCEGKLLDETGDKSAAGEKSVSLGQRLGFPSVGVLLARASASRGLYPGTYRGDRLAYVTNCIRLGR